MNNQALERRRALVEASLSGLIALVLSLAVFGPILRWIAVGWSGGDMLSTYINVEMWQGFRYSVSDQYGFPLGMNLNYFPGIDITENTFAALVSTVAGTPFVGLNILILITFPLVGFLAYFLFRMTGLTGPLAIAGAVVFSLIPFHFGRALGHTYLATLYSAVTGMTLVLLVGSGRFERIVRQLRGRALSRSRKIWLAAAICLLVVITAWTGVYYAAFALLLGAAALLWRYIKGAAWTSILVEALPFAAISLLALVGFLPSLLTTMTDPPIGTLSDRLPYDSVVFAGYLAVLVLPLPASSLPGFEFYNRSVTEALAAGGWVESSAQSNYGTWVTTAALLVLIGGLIAKTRKRQRKAGTETPRADKKLFVSAQFIAYLITVCLLFFIPWGLNYLIAGTITAQIRAWNRLTPIILLLFLLGAAAILRNTRVARHPVAALGVSAGVLALTFVDAVLPFRQAYADNVSKGAEITKAGREYAADTNLAIPEECGVLQLPTMGYPEFGVMGNVNDYDHFWTSITNPEKRWSYGAVKATDAYVWAGQLPPIPSSEQVALLRGGNFCAIHLDTRAWREEDLPSVLQEFSTRFSDPVATGYDGDWLMFDIRAESPASEEYVANFFHQPMITADPVTTHALEQEGMDTWWWTKDQRTSFTLTPTREQTPVRVVRGEIAAPSCGPRPVTVTLSSGTERVRQNLIARPTQATPFELILNAPSAAPATLEVIATGQACEAEDFAAKRFARVGNLQTY